MFLEGSEGVEGTEHILGPLEPKCKTSGIAYWKGDKIKSLAVPSMHFLAVRSTDSCPTCTHVHPEKSDRSRDGWLTTTTDAWGWDWGTPRLTAFTCSQQRAQLQGDMPRT